MTRNTRVKIAHAFTLIEVLIGVLVLALGVLGLGAIIPVVIRAQRNAADITHGTATANAAKADLLSKDGFNPQSTDVTVWDAFLDEGTAAASRWSLDGQWAPWTNRSLQSLTRTGPTTRQLRTWLFEFDGAGEGEVTWASTTVSTQQWNASTGNWVATGTANSPLRYTLPIATRLWPNPAGQPVNTLNTGSDPYRPQFAWDIVARRVPVAAGEPGKIQVAVFVRRIDLNIRVPRAVPPANFTLADILTDWTNARGTTDQDRCFPVAMDKVTSTSGGRTGSVGLPTNRGNVTPGTRYYAEPVYLSATFNSNSPDRLILTDLTDPTDNRWRLASQPGQKLVDNLGNIYTVIGPPTENTGSSRGLVLLVDPPVPAWVPDPSGPNPGGPGLNPAKLNQVVFTPQIPAAVSLFTITRPVN